MFKLLSLIIFSFSITFASQHEIKQKYHVGDCLQEKNSEAIIYITEIQDGKYFYAIFMFGMMAFESKEIKKMDLEEIIRIDCRRKGSDDTYGNNSSKKVTGI